MDDFLQAGYQTLKKKLCQRFLAGEVEKRLFSYTGIRFLLMQTKDRTTQYHKKKLRWQSRLNHHEWMPRVTVGVAR